MSEYLVKTKHPSMRTSIISQLEALGTVEDLWRDFSFNFKCYDSQCVDEMVEILDAANIDYKLI